MLSSSTESRQSKIFVLARTGIMAAITCVLAPMALPTGSVPISLATLALYFSVYLLGWKLATVSCVTYLLLGLVGIPVFSGFTGGMGKLLGPTGGYILGYIPLVILSGLAVEKSTGRVIQFLGLAAGTAACYALGTAWYCAEAGVPLQAALSTCVYLFIPGDLVKIAAAMVFGPMIRRRLEKAGLLGEIGQKKPQ